MNGMQKPQALLPATGVIPLVDVVDILVQAEEPVKFAEPESRQTVGWEIVARKVRPMVLLAAGTGALRVHRRGNWMQTAFDRNEPAEYDVTVDDLAKWLESPSMAYELERETGSAMPRSGNATQGNEPAVVSVTRGVVIDSFQVILGDAANMKFWDDKLSDPPEWLRGARTSTGKRGVSALWDPLLVAHALLGKKGMTPRALDKVMRERFSNHYDEWLAQTTDVDR